MTEIVEGRDLRTGLAVRVAIDEGRIASVDGREDAAELPWLGPGLVDLQVNGCAEFDFNAEVLEGDAVRGASLHLAAHGVTSFLPTLVTGPEERITSSLGTIAESIATCEGARISGIHLEGPFISPESGPRGAHDERFVRPPDWQLFERWQESAQGAIRIVTLAPEWPGALEFIDSCVGAGVLVAIGHTAADNDRIREAVAAGAQLSTHLGNGCHPTIPRHTGYFWAQLGCDELYASLIADGVHLSRDVLSVLLRTKGELAIVVSDSVSSAFETPGEYESPIGSSVVLTSDGRLQLASDPDLLAGSMYLLDDAVGYLVRTGLADLAEAWEMCSTRPARLLRLPQAAGVQVGAPADLVLFDWDGIAVGHRAVYREGRLVTRPVAAL
jgi:N-acetylglucosamine-6-phosphate deacetylase